MRCFFFRSPLFRMLSIFIAATLFIGCTKKLTKSFILYENNFEQEGQKTVSIYDNTGLITTSKIFDFNGSKVLGPFNNNAAIVSIKNIPEHNVLEVAYDLYIHDNWQGNTKASNGIPDLFVVNYDGNLKFLTTFSNHTPYLQGYPDWYPAGNNPTHGNAIQINLPGRCLWKDSAQGTSLYRIVQSFGHDQPSFELSLSDALQPFAAICEKSWSIDELTITVYKYF